MKRYRKNNVTVYIVQEGDLPSNAYTHRLPAGERTREPNKGRFWIEISPQAAEVLGEHGRLLAWSKAAYLDAHPEDEVLFNACVFDDGGLLIWFGDLNLTLEAELLQRLADRLGEAIYVTPERPFGFQGLPPAVERSRGGGTRPFLPGSQRAAGASGGE
mgnify:CR=1 FL=1